MTYTQLANGWKAYMYDDGTFRGKPVFWKSHGKVIEISIGKPAPTEALS